MVALAEWEVVGGTMAGRELLDIKAVKEAAGDVAACMDGGTGEESTVGTEAARKVGTAVVEKTVMHWVAAATVTTAGWAGVEGRK